MKKLLLLSLLMVPALLLASGHGETSSDFFPRVFNFSIFAAFLYYMLANPIKEYFKSRTAGISGRLQEIEEKLQRAKDEKKEAQTRLKESEKSAEQILADAKKEAVLLSNNIGKANENDIETMSKSYTEKVALEERKAAREAIDEILSDNITSDDIILDETKVVDIISKKVA